MNVSGMCLSTMQIKQVPKSLSRCNKIDKESKTSTYLKGISSLKKSGDKLLATFVNQMVANAFDLPAEKLLLGGRGNARENRARQISIYLMHTGLSFSLSKISYVYAKDRTTIGYACRVVEDLRDSPAFDDRMIELEQTISTVLKLAAYVPEKEAISD